MVALAIWAGPVLASAGADTRCDQSVHKVDMPGEKPADMALEVINKPYIRTIDADESEAVDASSLNVDERDTSDEITPKAKTSESDPAAAVPGLSQDDLIRFKRQMYRKDI